MGEEKLSETKFVLNLESNNLFWWTYTTEIDRRV